MAKDKCSKQNKIYVAIDVSKNKLDVLIEYPNGSNKGLIIKQNKSEFERLLMKIKKSGFETIVGFEATGYYHRAIAHYLATSGLTIKLVSSIATARTRESQYNSKDKNDKKDTFVILYLLKSDITQQYYDPLINNIIDFQELSNTYRNVSMRKTNLQHSIINHYLVLYFPEAEQYFCSTRAKWFAQFFYEFPCPNAITQYTQEAFIDKAYKLAGRKVDKINWLKGVYSNAENSIGLPIEPHSKTIEMFKLTLNDFSNLCTLRADIEHQADLFLADNEDYQRLKTVPGIGPIIALTILAEAGNIRRFGHINQFLKFCGFDLTTKQSGTFRGKTTLSKRGNSDLRKMFWMAATIATRMRENTFRRKYENYLRNTSKDADTKRKAYVAVAAKMARVVHSMITHNTDYYFTVLKTNYISQQNFQTRSTRSAMLPSGPPFNGLICWVITDLHRNSTELWYKNLNER